MTKNAAILIALLCLILNGCFVPVEVEPQGDCKLESKEWTIKLSGAGSEAAVGASKGAFESSHGCRSSECALLAVGMILVIPVTSAIISGSVAIIGNTIHWIEKQGVCEDSETQMAVNDLAELAKEAGGSVVITAEEFTDWITGFFDSKEEPQSVGPRPIKLKYN